MVSSKCMASFS